MNQLQPRHEFKHYINLVEVMALRQRLCAVMQPDSHARPDGTYRVRSLYFDNYEDKALREKMDGVSEREKFRLRFYGEDASLIKLERKAKQQGLCYKSTAVISPENCRHLLAGDTSWMLGEANPVFHNLYAKIMNQLLRPRTLVEYTREAYLFAPGNVRVTLDSNIRTGLNSTDFLNPGLITLEAGLSGQTVLEVKYDEFLPDIIADIIQVENRQTTAVSKYAACRICG